MKKSNSILVKAINEADTIKAGALKNANELLFEMFQPKIKKYINKAVNEELMSSPETVTSDFDQDDSISNTENPEDTINTGGKGAPVLESEDGDEDDEIVDEQVDTEEDDEEIIEVDETDLEDDDLSEQLDLDGEEDTLEEQDIDLDDEDIVEDFNALDDDDIVEIDDNLLDGEDDMDEQVMDDDNDTLDEVDIDGDINDEDEIAEGLYESKRNLRKLKLENRKLRMINRRLKNESAKTTKGFEILRRKLAEVNLFNQKLSYSMKAINNQGSISTSEKKSIVEQFDRCNNLREVQITFNALNKFNKKKRVASNMNEGTRRMLNKINENKKTTSSNNNGSFSSRSLRMAGLE